MSRQFSITDAQTRGILQGLLPPCSKNALLLYGFTYSPPSNTGQTYEIPTTENVVAPGNGTVTKVERRPNVWRHSAGTLDTDASWQITIDHTRGITSTVQGILTPVVRAGQPVTQGTALGLPTTGEIFLQVLYFNTPLDPSAINRYFRTYESKVSGKLGYVRQGADAQTRPGEEIGIWEEDGVHYYADIYCRKSTLLLNIDFNGSGAMAGTAVVGVYGTDYWNVYTPTAFDYTNGTLCYELVPGDAEASTYTSFGVGTLVETLHTGTTTDHLAFFAGTNVETLHTGTVGDYAIFSIGTNVETLHTGTSAVSVAFLSGGTEAVPPFLDGGTVASSIASGTLFVSIVPGEGAEGAVLYSTITSGSLWT